MNAPIRASRTPISLALALCASVGTFACGAAPPDALPTTTASPDGGTPLLPGYDAGSLSPFDGGSPDSAPFEAGSLEGGACPTGQADCDDNPSNGCETNVAGDPKNCGACGHDCTALPHVSGTGVTCDMGACVVPASACATGYGHCSSNPNDGCEADLGTTQTCGSCSTQCSGATPDCSGGGCTDGCAAATPTSCSGSCVDTTSSYTNCGACGNACPAPTYGSATCTMSTCGFDCNSGHHTCGSACADDTSPATCGSSCTPCAAPNGGVATCTPQGACGFACDIGFHSCDGATCSSGSSTATCGSSCTACAAPAANGSSTCDGTSCGIACDSGFHQCGATSCDSNSDVASCGASCTPCAAPASNGMPTCDGTSCGIACDAGYHLCGGNACDSSTSIASCGSSCTACATPPNATPTCDGTSCGYTCDTGYGDCDGNPTNGCEANLTDDGLNCNACAHSCLGGACTGRACQPFVLASVANPSLIAIDATRVYFLEGPSTGTAFGAVSKTGGAVSSTHVTINPLAFTVNGTTLDELDSSDIEGIATSQIGTGSFSQTTYDPTISSVSGGQWVVAAAGRLFWTSDARRSIATTTQELGPGGSPPQTLLTLPSGSEVVNLIGTPDGALAWNQCTANDCSIWLGTPVCNGVPTTCTLTGTSPLSGPGRSNLFADATYLYVQSASAITTVVRSTANILGLTAVTAYLEPGFTVEGGVAYWVTGGVVSSAQLGVGTPTTVFTDPLMYAFAVDSRAFYWTTGTTTGAVMELAR